MAAKEHMQAGSVRAFVLGLLDNDAAAAVEGRCFSDRAYFLSVQSEERRLIADYVAGRLPADEERAFKAQTRKLPALREEVEAARAEYEASTHSGKHRLGVVLALATTALLVVTGSLWMTRQDHAEMTILRIPIPPRLPALEAKVLDLPAGTYMDGGSGIPHMPRTTGTIRMRISLPGQTSAVTGRIRIDLLSADGAWKAHWTGDHQVRSEPTPYGQVLFFEVAGSLLAPGEYRTQIVSDPPLPAEFRRFRIDRHRN
ncbi:MAG: hypothetical protein U0R19_11415 [Bryobacteraceae bacterium]